VPMHFKVECQWDSTYISKGLHLVKSTFITLLSKMILTNSFRIVVPFRKLVPSKRMAVSSKWIRHHSNNNNQEPIQELTQAEVEDTMPAKGTAAALLLIRAAGVNKDEYRQFSISIKITRFNVRMSRGTSNKMLKIGQRKRKNLS
jgi:hypothetical protein